MSKLCRNAAGPPGVAWPIAVALLLFVCLLSGCSAMLASSGVTTVDAIPNGMTRKEIRDRFGEPVSTSTTSFDRDTEIYHIRLRLDSIVQSYHRAAGFARFDAETGWTACLINPLYCLFWDALYFPYTAMESEKNRIHVAFVYGRTDRALYYYKLNADSSSRFNQAIRPMPHALYDEEKFNTCPSVVFCVTEFVEELRIRAIEVGHTIGPEADQTFLRELEAAQKIDDHEITREDAIKHLENASPHGGYIGPHQPHASRRAIHGAG